MEASKGNNSYVDKILRHVSETDRDNMDYFYLESLTRTYESGNNDVLVQSPLSYEENDLLLNYSGYNYKHINAVLRGIWTYEENGDIGKANEYLSLAKQLSEIISSHPTTLNNNIMTYRGVDLNYFKQYGIESLEDLKSLEGKYMMDRAFVSTSIEENNSFFKKDNELGKNYNVKIEYMIPKEFRDGIFLDGNSSYSPNQREFLINASNLTRVSGVVINEDNTAVVKATVIPKELYDEYYRTKARNASK